MKANELMVGDIFMVNKDVSFKRGTIVMVHGIDADRMFHELKGCATCVDIDDQDEMQGGVWLDYLDPIPLTPEILEKNGWSPVEGVCASILKHNGYNLSILHWAKPGVNLTIDKGGYGPNLVCMPICYVHELQHALRLCGIEKEIVL